MSFTGTKKTVARHIFPAAGAFINGFFRQNASLYARKKDKAF